MGQTDRQTDGRIAVSLNARVRQGIIKRPGAADGPRDALFRLKSCCCTINCKNNLNDKSARNQEAIITNLTTLAID